MEWKALLSSGSALLLGQEIFFDPNRIGMVFVNNLISIPLHPGAYFRKEWISVFSCRSMGFKAYQFWAAANVFEDIPLRSFHVSRENVNIPIINLVERNSARYNSARFQCGKNPEAIAGLVANCAKKVAPPFSYSSTRSFTSQTAAQTTRIRGSLLKVRCSHSARQGTASTSVADLKLCSLSNGRTCENPGRPTPTSTI